MEYVQRTEAGEDLDVDPRGGLVSGMLARGGLAGAPGPCYDNTVVDDVRQELIALLQAAYSGERAAAYAYRGHWHSLHTAVDRDRVRTIEREEWHHRELVGEILRELGAAPRRLFEIRTYCIGRALGVLCHVSGWLAPMFGAGKIESRNVREYEAAARLAQRYGRDEWADCLLEMAEVEWEHEAYFRSKVLSHRLGRKLKLWTAPPPKAEIRASFARECTPPARPSPRARLSAPIRFYGHIS
ncbi:MAG: hypothetical protein CMJ89_02895 [Planctomycetes bacterium]|nr:hypothetical protein [Planctomycetota bacterium]